jgi:hypothetical protein
MSKVYTKEDVEFHSDGYRASRPAVNVKVYRSINDVKLPICLGGSRPASEPETPIRWSYTEPEFTADRVRETFSDEEIQGYWDFALEQGWEYLQSIAEDVFSDYNVKVWSEGRSGGWAVVDGLPDFDSWDVVMLGKWRSFERQAKAVANGIPEDVMTTIYINMFEND